MTRPAALATLLVPLALAQGLAAEARACSCEAVDFARSFAGSELVFEADVVALIENPAHHLRATLTITRTWKGTPGAELVYDGDDSNTCGVDFVNGERFVVFGSLEQGLLGTSYCNGTARGAGATRALAWLEENASPTPAVTEPPAHGGPPVGGEPPRTGVPAFAEPDAFPDTKGEGEPKSATAGGCGASRDKTAPLAPLVMLPWLVLRRRTRCASPVTARERRSTRR